MTATATLPIEGALPELGGATAWLNSEPLTPAGLRGKVVVVQFCANAVAQRRGEDLSADVTRSDS